MNKKFYISQTPRCWVHSPKPAGYMVKSQGELYRHACTEACAKKQAKELSEAWSK